MPWSSQALCSEAGAELSPSSCTWRKVSRACPVFSLGRAGFIHLFGPTGGYLVGFIAAAWLTGFLVERRVAAKLPGALLVIILGLLVPYIPGVAWLAISAVGFPKAFVLGFLPFLVGDGMKVVVAVGVLEGANILGTKSAQRRQAL